MIIFLHVAASAALNPARPEKTPRRRIGKRFRGPPDFPLCLPL